MVVECRFERVLQEMPHELVPRVEHAAGLPSTSLGLVVQVASAHLDVLPGDGRADQVTLRVVGEVLGGAGQPQRQQRLVDGSQVTDLKACVVEPGFACSIRLVGDCRQGWREERVGDGRILQQVAPRESVRGETTGRCRRALQRRRRPSGSSPPTCGAGPQYCVDLLLGVAPAASRASSASFVALCGRYADDSIGR